MSGDFREHLSVDTLPVAVVVVTWNSAAEIDRCIRAALAQNPSEIVVVDNASTDQTLEIIQGYASVKVLRQHDNIGFCQANNLGFAATTAPYVLALNADAFLEPGYLAGLVAVMDNMPEVASAAGKLVYERNAQRYIDSTGIALQRWKLNPYDVGHAELDRGQYDTGRFAFGVSAAAALYRRSALDDLQEVFDEELFAYYEDVDLAWRLGRCGFKHYYEPSALAYHDRRGPDSKPKAIAARAFRNRYLVWLRNESPWRFMSYGPLALMWEVGRIVRRALSQPATLSEIPSVLPLLKKMLAKRGR